MKNQKKLRNKENTESSGRTRGKYISSSCGTTRKINEVHEEEQELHEDFNASADDGIKIINS